MRSDAFSKRHPAVNFAFFLGAICSAVIIQHPAYLAVGIVSGSCYYLLLHRRKGLRNILSMLPLFLVLTLINPLFNRYGERVLFWYFGRPYTWEALLYGMAISGIFLEMLLWFGCYNAVLTSDKFTSLFGNVIPALSLLLVPTLFVPVVFPLFKLYGESAAIATALAVTGFLSIPLHAYSISAVTGVLRAGGDVFWSTLLDVGPQWCMALPLTALLALVLKADYWWIAAAIQSESLLKVPLCALRIRTGQWIHDVTVRKERGQ